VSADALDSLLEGDAYYQCPYPAFARLRDESPVHWHAASQSWLVARWDDADAALRAPRSYSSYGYQNAYFERLRPELRAEAPTLELRGRTPTLITSDPPHHTRLRRLLQTAFTPRAIEGLQPRVETLVLELLDELSARAEADLVADLAYPLPAMMIADILGVPRQDRGLFKQVSSDVVRFMNRTNPNAELSVEFARTADRSLAGLRAYLRNLIDEHRLRPSDDLLSTLIDAEFEGDALEEEELLANLVLFLIAGHETTTGLISSAVHILLEHPDQMESVRGDRTRLPAAAAEALRFESPVQRVRRVVSEDITLAGVTVRTGQPVEILIGSANRDPARFERADEFDITREAVPSLAFGKGVHRCIGESLALLEAETALAAVLDRYPGLALAPGWEPEWSGLTNLRCLRSLTVSLTGGRSRR
jgi:cytochrome P450